MSAQRIYRIRFHGRGGQGMKTASRILGTALFLEGFEVQDAPRYGAERRGAPIFAYVRASRSPINERGVIRRPGLVVVADETLMAVPAAGVIAGAGPGTVLLVHGDTAASEWRQRLNFPGEVLTLATSVGSDDCAALRSVGPACAGAAARLTGAVSRVSLEEALRTELAPLGKETVTRNLERALDAYEAMTGNAGRVRPVEPQPVAGAQPPDWVDLPFEVARVAAPTIHGGATSEAVPTGLWRTLRPVVQRERCNRCWWVCTTFCPDSAITRDEAGYPVIDYEHCKGCLVCVAQCPPHAIEAVPERAAQRAAGESSP